MSFVLFSDSSSNITPDLAAEWDVRILSLHYELSGEEHPAYDERFDGRAFYDALRRREPVRTSMINSTLFAEAFEPVLAAGEDLIYIAMSSGISGTAHAAQMAADELMAKYPGRKALDFAESVGEDNFGCHNTDAHLRSSIIGRNVTIVMEDGELDLGEFGRIHFIDWDQTRARKRTVQVMLIDE